MSVLALSLAPRGPFRRDVDVPHRSGVEAATSSLKGYREFRVVDGSGIVRYPARKTYIRIESGWKTGLPTEVIWDTPVTEVFG